MATRSYQLAVDIRDQLTVAQDMCNYQPMVETQELRFAFAERLNDALDQMPGVRQGRGRNVDLYIGIKDHPSAKASKQATHKWLAGESMPGRSNMLAIADRLKVRVEWLAHGEGDMRLGRAEQPSASDLVAIGKALFDSATPKSQALINKIAALDAQGKLTDEEISIVEKIIERFGDPK